MPILARPHCCSEAPLVLMVQLSSWFSEDRRSVRDATVWEMSRGRGQETLGAERRHGSSHLLRRVHPLPGGGFSVPPSAAETVRPPPQRLRPHLGPCSAIKPCSRGASLARLKTKQACTMPHKHLDHWNLIVERRPMHCRVTRAVTIVRSALPHLYRLFQKCHAGSNPVPKCVPLLTCTNSRFNATSHNCGKARGENPFANEVALWAASAGRDRK